jgi:hypothetical protein
VAELVEVVGMILDKLKAYGAIAAAIALGALLLVQTGRLHTEQVAHEKLKTSTAQAAAQRTSAALAQAQRNAASKSTHATATQENSDAFTTSQPVRDAIARADRATADRLRVGAERRAATYRAQAQSNAAACSDLADRYAALDAHVVRGAGVVAGLGADLGRRDAEVALLRRQVDIERNLTSTNDE